VLISTVINAFKIAPLSSVADANLVSLSTSSPMSVLLHVLLSLSLLLLLIRIMLEEKALLTADHWLMESTIDSITM
jgi:hypothetical protein